MDIFIFRKVKRMAQKYIVGDVVMYDNKIMVVKEPRDGSHFDLSCPKEGLVYCFVDIEEIKSVRLTPEILEKNGWKDDGYDWYRLPTKRAYLYITKDMTTLGEFLVCVGLDRHNIASISFVHQLQHLLFGLGLNSEMEV
jgi:hypothetical protein